MKKSLTSEKETTEHWKRKFLTQRDEYNSTLELLVKTKAERDGYEEKLKQKESEVRTVEGERNGCEKRNAEQALFIDFFKTQADGAETEHVSAMKGCETVIRAYEAMKRAHKRAYKQKLDAFDRWGWTRLVSPPDGDPELSPTLEQGFCKVLAENWAEDTQCTRIESVVHPKDFTRDLCYRSALHRAFLKALRLS